MPNNKLQPISADPIARLAEQQHWILPSAERAAQRAIRSTLDGIGGEPLRSALHGDWLHEPLHAVLTDVPVGAWTGAVLFDAIAAISGNERMNTAADASVILGLAGAVGAAITGMNDWSEIKQVAPRRIGAVHALLNIAATGFFTWSCLARRKRSTRNNGRSAAILGYLLVSASAHLGGNLVYEHGIGVTAKKPRRSASLEDAMQGS